MRNAYAASVALSLVALVACTAQEAGETAPPSPVTNPAAGTRPAGEPVTVIHEGLVGAGTECRTLTTKSGEIWAFSDTENETRIGDYVRITGEVADASYCMEGRGTLIPFTIEKLRDAD